MQAALRFIGTNLWGFSQSRTVSLTLTHQRRLNISAILCFIVPQVGLGLPYPKAANIFACISWLALRGVPCTLNRKGCTLWRRGGGVFPLALRSAGVRPKRKDGGLSAPAVAVLCLRLWWSAFSPARYSLRGSILRRLPLPATVQRSLLLPFA